MATNVGGYGLCRGRRPRYSDFFAARGYAFAMDTADLPPEDGPEAEFARRIAAGPPGSSVDAEAGLYRLLAPRVRRYGQRHLRDEHAAEDLMQHVMAMTIEQLRAIPGLTLYGNPRHRSSILPFNVEGIQHYDMGILLDTSGVAVRTGGEKTSFARGYGATEPGPTACNVHWPNETMGLIPARNDSQFGYVVESPQLKREAELAAEYGVGFAGIKEAAKLSTIMQDALGKLVTDELTVEDTVAKIQEEYTAALQ